MRCATSSPNRQREVRGAEWRNIFASHPETSWWTTSSNQQDQNQVDARSAGLEALPLRFATRETYGIQSACLRPDTRRFLLQPGPGDLPCVPRARVQRACSELPACDRAQRRLG